jgi:hypothetical protein
MLLGWPYHFTDPVDWGGAVSGELEVRLIPTFTIKLMSRSAIQDPQSISSATRLLWAFNVVRVGPETFAVVSKTAVVPAKKLRRETSASMSLSSCATPSS